MIAGMIHGGREDEVAMLKIKDKMGLRHSRTFVKQNACAGKNSRTARPPKDDYQQPDPFFEEMGERLVLIGQEVLPSSYVGDRIDLLAIDEKGAAVIIELKRSEQKLQLLQSLSYAAMLSDWSAENFVNARS